MISSAQLDDLARDATASLGETVADLDVLRETALPDLIARMYRIADTGRYVLAAADDSGSLVLYSTLQLTASTNIVAAYETRHDYAWSTLVGMGSLLRLKDIVPEADRGFGSYESEGDAAGAMALQMDRGLWERLGDRRDWVFDRSVRIARDEYRLARAPDTWKSLLVVAILEAPVVSEEEGITYVAAAESGDLQVLAKRVVSTA